jgi:hypothetical protein
VPRFNSLRANAHILIASREDRDTIYAHALLKILEG